MINLMAKFAKSMQDMPFISKKHITKIAKSTCVLSLAEIQSDVTARNIKFGLVNTETNKGTKATDRICEIKKYHDF